MQKGTTRRAGPSRPAEEGIMVKEWAANTRSLRGRRAFLQTENETGAVPGASQASGSFAGVARPVL